LSEFGILTLVDNFLQNPFTQHTADIHKQGSYSKV
jgi:hypothetical protein